MAKKKQVKITIMDGENENTKIFVLSQDIHDLDTYERSKAINNFINKETSVLATCVENHLRQALIGYGIIPKDGKFDTLNSALNDLKYLHHKEIEVRNRYVDTLETIIGENELYDMTIINESDILSCAVEVEVRDYGR